MLFKTTIQAQIIATLFISSSAFAQNVGIGEPSPAQKLQIDGSATGLQTIRVEDLATAQAGDFGQASGANIQTASTTSKGVYVDANGDMTARYIYGDNIKTVAPTTGTQTLSTTALTDLTGLTLTFTPRHSVVYLSFAVSGYNPLTGALPHGWVVVNVDKDAVSVGNFLSMGAATDGSGSYGAATVSTGMFPITVTPGTATTIKLRGRVIDATTNGRFTVDKANYTSYITILD